MEKVPVQKEFGEIEWWGNQIRIKKFGTKKQVGQITLLKEKKPIPHYHAHSLWISRKERGKGFASQLIEEVEKVTRERGVSVITIENINERTSPNAVGMYRRVGWTEIPNAKQWRSAYVYGASDQEIAEFRRFFGSSKKG